MKKLLYTLLAVSIIFASCKKEEDEVVTPIVISGCMDALSLNYDATATLDDGSCTYTTVIPGCMDTLALNYDANVTVDDGSCTYTGCMDAIATNYDATASSDDGSCIYSIVGTWTPTSLSVTNSMSVTIMGEIVDEFDTTFTMTSTDPDWDFTDVEFTADGQMLMDGETNSYSHLGNVLIITEDEGPETHLCTVTSTSLTVIMSETETYTEDYMGQEATITESNDMTLNCTRQ